MDVAWAAITENAPMMSDPHRYRHHMYMLVWEGKQPELTMEERKALREAEERKARGEIGQGAGRSKISDLQKLESFAANLRAQQGTDEPK